MPEGTTAPGSNPGTPEQQLNTEVTLGKVYNTINQMIPWGSGAPIEAGGGGAGGHFTLSVPALNALIAQWTSVRDKIEASGDKLGIAANLVQPPADDTMSNAEADATRDSLRKAIEHNQAMRDYAQSYIDKLVKARNDYENTEGHNTSAVRSSDGV